MRKLKKSKPTDSDQSATTRRRLGCLLGCLSIVLLLFIILTLALYLVLHTLREPPADSFLVPETRMVFILNFNVDSPPLRTFLWKFLRAYYSNQNTEITYQEFTTKCTLLKFFFYPKVLILFQEGESPASLSSSVVLNFRRAVIVFRYLFSRAQKDTSFRALRKAGTRLNYAFVKNSLIISDDFSAQKKIISRRKGTDNRPIPGDLKHFVITHSQIKRPEYLLTGFLDNNANWVGNFMKALSHITPGEIQSNVLKEFFSRNEWTEIPWNSLNKGIIRLKLPNADTFLLTLELYFKDSASVRVIEPILRESILPYLKDLLTEEFVVTYDTDARDSMLIISLQMKQTAIFFQSIFKE
ncbi:hypothetical protein J7M23_09010 [Candidatus Sumerlaeota bacterium]|nr:hypothetical protein [Candidatus Sumerlaeota bacterium]